jgi:hypothetical protein
MGARQLDHLTIDVANRDTACAFYATTQEQLGLTESEEPRGS